MKNIRSSILFSLFFSVLALPVQAAFDVMNDNYAPTQYGNAQTGSFHRAITGGSPITPEEQAQLASMLPVKGYPGYYGRLRLNFSTLTLDEFKNKSSGVYSNGVINKKRTSGNQVGFEIGIGYSWSANLRGELEYLAVKTLSYVANPALLGSGVPSVQLNSQIKNNTILANLYYDFSGLNRFKPYVTAGIGLSANSVQATLFPAPAIGGSNTQRNIRAAWDLGVGFRVAIFSHWYLDAAYRYIRLGNGIGIVPNSSFKFLSTYSMNALSLGFNYLF